MYGVGCVRQPELARFIHAVLTAAGIGAPAVAAMARALVGASARGVDTHGVRLLPLYMDYLDNGRVLPHAEPSFEQQSPAAGMVDGHHCFGHLASYFAIEQGINIARTQGVAAITVRHSSHHGASGCYALAAAEAGFVALSLTNTDRVVVPHGGVRSFFGTNPIGFAMPAMPGEPPLLIDMATSAIPFNRVFLRRSTGESLPAAVAVDDKGLPVEDPHAAAALLPLGGMNYSYKGAALAMMVELLCSGLSGGALGPELPSFHNGKSTNPEVSHFFLIIDPCAFTPPGGTQAQVSRLRDLLRAEPAQPGQQVQAPGDPEINYEAMRKTTGIPLDPDTYASFQSLAQRFAVPLPVFV